LHLRAEQLSRPKNIRRGSGHEKGRCRLRYENGGRISAGSLKCGQNVKLFKIFCCFFDPNGFPKVRKFIDKVSVLVYRHFRSKFAFKKRTNKGKF
jgi:hypothetical protein